MARRRSASARFVPAVVARRSRCRALLVVDNAPLQATAWAELREARSRLKRATRDLHRHEQVDEPGFRVWLGATFPELVTAVRDLTQQIAAKARIVEAVESESWISGRSPRAIWRTWQREAARPPSRETEPEHEPQEPPRADTAESDPWADDDIPSTDAAAERRAFEAMFEDFCAMQGIDPNDPAAEAMRDTAARMAGFDLSADHSRSAMNDARDIYRRLVQHLHPDRGGEWTPERARLWHEVQAAWDARDADMLARLEAEWDIAADTLSPTSAVSRLRAALAELHAARRDVERKVRHYRQMPDWRFSLKPPDARKSDELRRTLEIQRKMLTDDLARLEAIIAGWERTAKKRRARRGGSESAMPPEFAFEFGMP